MGLRLSKTVWALLTVTIVGCGGVTPRGGGPLNSPGPNAPTGTAIVTVDTRAGTVSVKKLRGPAGSMAVFTGTAVTFTTSNLLNDVGELSTSVIQVQLTNNQSQPIGGSFGFNVLFGPFTNLSAPTLDLRSLTTVTTIAGNGTTGYKDGSGVSASIKGPSGLLFDSQAPAVYFCTADGRIRKYKAGTVSTVAGGAGSLLKGPAGLAFATGLSGLPDNSNIYVADSVANQVFSVNVATGVVTSVAGSSTSGSTDGSPSSATFSAPTGIAAGTQGFYVADNGTGKIRFLSYTPGIGITNVTTVASGLSKPAGVTVFGTNAAAGTDGYLGVAETGNNWIDVYQLGVSNSPLGSPAVIGTGTAGTTNGMGASATFTAPQGITAGNGALFVTDTGSNEIRQLSLMASGGATSAGNWLVTSLAGSGTAGSSDGNGNTATLNAPSGILADLNGNLVIGDTSANLLRRVVPTNGFFPIQVNGATGTVPADSVRLANPTGFVPTNTTSSPYISEHFAIAPGQTVSLHPWQLYIPQGVSLFQFTVTVEGDTQYTEPVGAVLNPGPSYAPGSPYVNVRTLTGAPLSSFNNGTLDQAGFGGLSGAAIDSAGNLYVTDSVNNALRFISPSGNVSTIVGVLGTSGALDGAGSAAEFSGPTGIALGPSDPANPGGIVLYVADSGNNTIRRVTSNPGALDLSVAGNYTVSTIAGEPGGAAYASGSGNLARFNQPWGIAISESGELFVTETAGNRVRHLVPVGSNLSSPASWMVSLYAGDASATAGTAGVTNGIGASARFSAPMGIAIAASGELYVADTLNCRIRKITVGANVSIFSGTLVGYVDSDTPTTAEFKQPVGIAVDPSGYLFVTDKQNTYVRRVSPTGGARTVAGTGTAGLSDGTGATGQFGASLAGILEKPDGDIVVCDGTRLRLVERVISTGTSGSPLIGPKAK
ncbi:MAG: hypothetical protein P4L46_07525 [Fimbriimonas sp.]|nr:hypothetical protein [Fimbriimonas sp.]